jgi:hypothetical protein
MSWRRIPSGHLFQFMATVRSKSERCGGILRDIDMSPDEFERLWEER